MTCDLQKKPAIHLVYVSLNVVRANDCFFAYHQATMSVPVLLLAIFILFGLVLSVDSGNRSVMLCVQFILQTITTIHELCHCFDNTRSKVQKSYNLILLFVIKLLK